MFFKTATGWVILGATALSFSGCVPGSVTLPPSSNDHSSLTGSGNSSSAEAADPSAPTTGLKANQLALLVNDNDPNSITVANYYIAKRNIPLANVVHVSLPTTASITRTQFAPFKAQVDAALGPEIQAIAVAWTNPSRVECNSMTSALARGFDSGPCDSSTCNLGTISPYYESSSKQPFTDYGMRPTMMLAGLTVADVKAMIDRGVASDNTHPHGSMYLMDTSDSVRSVRATYFHSTYLHAGGYGVSPDVYIDYVVANEVTGKTDTLFYMQGLASVPDIATNTYPPGAIADHLTSFGGMLTDSGQMSCLKWIQAGATGTFGTVSEPCAYLSKFPDPLNLVEHYTAGETLIEAYWKSVNQTFQGEFVGEPLANPWMKNL